MENCKLVDELNRLRKSSRDSIDGIGDFGDFKKYMHISRNVEEELIEILHKIEVSGRKSLVLLCGSAGDGKSHLLSYLKNDLKLLDNYVVYNDATESSAPSKTAIETLSEALQGFSDKNLDQPGKNFILAINLGVLSNFVESTYGEAFKQLREYVINSNILTNQLDEKGYEKNSAFQHVSFSDYHMYNLTMHSIRGENKDFETECLKWKKEILKYYDAVDKACKNYTNNRKFYEELLNELKKEPIGIDRSEYKTQHSTVIKYCKEVVEENHTIDRIKFEEALKKLKDYLLNKLLVPYISSEVSIYKYDNGLNHFDGTKIFDGIVKLVKEYKGNIAGWSENQYKYLADKILNYIDKTILERHKNLQEKKCVVREISLSKLQEIMDTFVENNEKEANILALKRGYLESLDKFCQKCQRNNDYTCHDIDCKLQQAEYRKEKLNEEDFVRFCYNLRPECEKKIEDRACIADLGSKDGLMESVFPIIKEIPSERFIDKEDERQLKVRNHDKMAFVTAITNSDAEDAVLGIEQALDKNSVMIEAIFEADQLVTTRLEADENIWNQSCIKIRRDEIADGQKIENRDERSIYVAKRPQFVKAEAFIKDMEKDGE